MDGAYTMCLNYSTYLNYSNRRHTYWFQCTGLDNSKILVRNKWLPKQDIIPYSSMLYPCFLNKEHYKFSHDNGEVIQTCVTMPNPSVSLEVYTCAYSIHDDHMSIRHTSPWMIFISAVMAANKELFPLPTLPTTPIN